MALANLSDLMASVIKFAFRTGDADFAAAVPDMIAMGESQLNRRLQLRVMEGDTPLVGVIGSRLIPLPADYVEKIALHLTTSGQSVELRPDAAGEMAIDEAAGWPDGWSINGVNIELDRPCDQAHTFTFRYRKSFALSDAAPTNWLLTNHPDLYLAATMAWGANFMMDSESVVKWKALAEEAITEIAWQEARNSLTTAQVDPALTGRRSFNMVSG